MQLQIGYEFFQLSSQNQFSSIFGLCAIVDQQEIRMPIVEYSQFRSETKGDKSKTIQSQLREWF